MAYDDRIVGNDEALLQSVMTTLEVLRGRHPQSANLYAAAMLIALASREIQRRETPQER